MQKLIQGWKAYTFLFFIFLFSSLFCYGNAKSTKMCFTLPLFKAMGDQNYIKWTVKLKIMGKVFQFNFSEGLSIAVA